MPKVTLSADPYLDFFSYYESDKEIKAIKSLVNFKNKDVLDVGCGYGRLVKAVLPFAKSITAVDSNKDMLKKLPKSPKIKVVNSSMEEFKTNSTFDVILFVFAISFTKQPAEVIEKTYNLLRKNGIILIADSVPGCEEDKLLQEINKAYGSKVFDISGLWDKIYSFLDQNKIKYNNTEKTFYYKFPDQETGVAKYAGCFSSEPQFPKIKKAVEKFFSKKSNSYLEGKTKFLLIQK